ncbi:MAG: hypothetical protein P8Y02_13005 [Deinococcales bacterium]
MKAHVRHVARDRGLEDAFFGELALLDSRSQEALGTRSKELVEGALAETRALARRLAETQRDVARFAEHGRISADELTSTLLMPGDGEQA